MNKSFKNTVYELTRKIPHGKVATYGQIAILAGKAKAARAVGALMRINPDAPDTPCHRVVAADGKLTGYSGRGGITTKKAMLIKEGVAFKGDKVDLTKSAWNNFP